MSIADGQVVLVAGPGGAPAVDPAASISRIGGRAYPPALAALAPQVRCRLGVLGLDFLGFGCAGFWESCWARCFAGPLLARGSACPSSWP